MQTLGLKMAGRRILTLITLFVFAAPSSADDWRAFSLESDSWFAVQASGEGEVRIKDGKAEIRLTSAVVNGTSKVQEGLYLVGVQIGIAHYREKDDWEVVSLSKLQEAGAKLDEGGRIPIQSFEAAVSVPDTIASKEHWVVLQMSFIGPEKNPSFSFAHEPE